MKTAIVYARYSSDRQTEQSIEGQLRVCNDYAEKNGLVIVDTYIDRAMTGTNDNRPAFQQMLADSGKAAWDIVLVYALDRFGRNAAEVAVNKQRLKKNGKTLISATQRTSDNIDGTKNLDGIILENVYIGIAEYYSAELAQKVKRGMNENREKGLFCGGKVSYGYNVVDKKVIVNEDEAEIVRYIFDSYVNGAVVKDIIKALSDKGIYQRNGKPFTQNGIYKVLRMEKYIGVYRHDGIVYGNMYPQIVDKSVFDRVQSILLKNKKGSRSNCEDYILSDIMYCGYCGKHMVGESGTARNGERKYYYKCITRKKENACHKHTVKKDEIENYVFNVCLDTFATPENVRKIADGVISGMREKQENNHELNILKTEQTETQRALDNIMRAIEQGIFNDTTKRRMDELEERLAILKTKITSKQYAIDNSITGNDIVDFISDALKQKENADRLIHLLVDRIILFDGVTVIFFKFGVTPQDETTDEYYDETTKQVLENVKEKGLCEHNGSDSPTLVEISGFEPLTS